MNHYEFVKSQIHGPVVGLLTPFSKDGSVDYESLVPYIEHQLAAGLDVLAFSPMVSSLCVLTTAETLAVAARTKQIVGNRALVLGSTRGDSPLETFNLLRGFETAGLDGAFIFPGYIGPKPDIYLRMLLTCCTITSLPLLGFSVSIEFDRRFGGLSWMDIDHWQRLAETPQIIGLKDDTGNTKGRLAVAKQFPNRFVIVGPGMPDRYIRVHHLPAQAELTSIGDLDMSAERRFHDALGARNEQDACTIMTRAMNCLERINVVGDCGWGIEPAQTIAYCRGLLDSPAMRPPLPTLTSPQIKAIHELINAYDDQSC